MGFKCESLKIADCDFFPRLQSLKRNISIYYGQAGHTRQTQSPQNLETHNHLTTNLKPVLR